MQRVAVTIRRDGFAAGSYEISEALPPGQTNLVWEQVHGQAIHFWRVLTLQPEGWVPSETARFRGPSCVADMRRGGGLNPETNKPNQEIKK